MSRTDVTARATWILSLGLLAAALLIVLFGSIQQNDWLFRCTTLIVLAISWNLMANAGLISLGHSAFWGIGSYAAVLSMNALAIPFGLAIVPALGAGFLLGIFLSRTTGRLSGIFFAIATLALSEGLRVVALMMPGITGGAEGLFIKTQVRPAPHTLFMVALAGAALCVACATWIAKSRYHYALRGMRNDESSVKMLGVDPLRFRMGITGISGAMASAAGATSTIYGGYIDPEIAFTLHNTILAQIAPILGGLYTISGPLVGAVAMVFLSEATRIWLVSLPGLSILFFGLILVLCVRFMPQGIVGLLERASDWLWRHVTPSAPEPSPAGAGKQQPIAPFASTAAVAPFGSMTDFRDAGVRPILTVNSVRAGYGDTVVLENVSFEVRPGEVVCLLGANGAGKTTTMSVLTGLLPAQSGTISFLGKDMLRLATHERVEAGLALSPEARQVFPNLTVLENLQLGSFAKSARSARDKRLDQAFELFPLLRERQRQRAGLMSGGEQQMLAIARALMSGPKLLLLDEPSLGLSPKLVQITFEAIDTIANTGISVLMVEQNTYAALSISQRGYVLAGGQIAASGTAAELASSSIVQESFLGREESPRDA